MAQGHAPFDPAWKQCVQHSYKLLIDTISAPTTTAPIDLVMMVLFVFEFHEKLSPTRPLGLRA